ncbi:hypothetical protein CAPTEDRAFT_227487 [Capitella teleta]|uniref:D-serine dehydratase-like domain-containing protein n=1 Tax=Capitella teleta TaxID=283909 RepID=R7V771_CAPTE|nr:hypothetical protein CAPTEDRAFT_227487 [Capitella teleta]|eukprot:ELU11615.1 hypothetical protein CAPTEDRAFT_227487 [Capitella teleta]
MSNMPDMKWGPPPPPCRHGDHIDTIETPALVVEMDALEKNLVTMATMMKKFPGVAWRPHYKAHKCPEIALMQTQSGACGVCCQTLVEAESLVHNQAANDIFITNQLVGKTKLQRLAVLCRQATVSICVDDPSHVVSLGLVAKEANVNIECVVEVCVGSRCGVQPGKAAVELAKEIIDTPHLSFKGIHVYGGQNQHIRSAEDRKQATDTVVEHAQRTLKEFDEADIRCPYVTGGGTGTFAYEACSGVFTEVQPGSFMFMDADYNKNLNEAGKHQELFHQSLFVLTSVQSARDGRAIVDVGLKGVSLDSGPPELVGKTKLQRLAVLCRQATVSICVDDPSHVVSLGLVAKEANVNIECVVEVCVGSRCGVQPGKAAVELAKEIIDTPHLSFKGIHVYGGQNQHIRSAEDRKQATDTVVEHAQRTLKEFDEADIRCPYVTGGGTGTFAYEACSGVFTEVQPGSFMFMDADYNKNLNEAGKHQELFHQSLFVLTSVQSARDGRAIVDVGLKGVSLDSGPPEIYVNPNLSYVIGGDEHGKLKANTELGQTTINKMEVGERLWLVPGHCDPTVNLHDWLVGMRHFQVEKMFAIAGRGPGV